MSKDPETGLEIDRGVTDEIFQETLEKLRDFSFKEGAARYQVQYLSQILRKPRGVSERACASRLQEINGYLRRFPGLDLNSPLADGEIVSILVTMIPLVWRRKMVNIDFEPLTKSLMDIIEYLEQLEVLEATEKKQNPKNSPSENETKESSKSKGAILHVWLEYNDNKEWLKS